VSQGAWIAAAILIGIVVYITIFGEWQYYQRIIFNTGSWNPATVKPISGAGAANLGLQAASALSTA
jgi:hypothetical protein